MDIAYIKRFIVVAECLNFSKAAEAMFISQPTLSHSITSIEKKLGAPLFVRNTKSVKLTPAGEIFLPAARDIVERFQKAAHDIDTELNLGSNALNIGYIGPAVDNTLSDWVKKFRKLNPEAKVQIHRYGSTKVGEAFRENEIHLGMLYKTTLDHLPGLKYRDLGTERFKVLLSSEHPLANCSRIDLQQLRDEPFLICERASSPDYYDKVLSICEKRGFRPEISQTLRLVSDIYSVVDAGLGVAIVSHSTRRTYGMYNIKFVDIDDGDDLNNDVVLAWANTLSPLARQFLSITQKLPE